VELIDYYLKIEIAVYRTVRTKDSFRNQKTKVEKNISRTCFQTDL
jgi:hypothetical protein